MIKPYIPVSTAIILLFSIIAKAEKYNINKDTIRVSSSSFPFIKFMGDVQNANLLCEDYKIVRTSNSITVRPKVSKPTPTCMLIVSEGTQSTQRQHTFIITFAKEVPASELLHDYSTKDLIEKRIHYLETGEKEESEAKAAGGDEPKEKKGLLGLGKKKVKMPKAEAPEVPKAEAPKAPKAEAPKVKTPKADTKKTVQKVKEESEEESAAQPDSPAPQTKTASFQTEGEENEEIKNIPIEKIEERVKLKINSFYDACGLLLAKTDIEESIKYGMKLFNNDEAVLVETTNGKTKTKSQKNIRPYLNHLSQLKYSKVEMTSSEIRFVSDFHMGPDKKWHASAVIIQDFTGYKDGVAVYNDKTNKTIDIIVNVFDVVKDGKVIKKFDIFLGNISVTNMP